MVSQPSLDLCVHKNEKWHIYLQRSFLDGEILLKS